MGKKIAKDATGIHLCNHKYTFKIPSMTNEASQLAYCKNILCEVCSANIWLSVRSSKRMHAVSLFRLIWHEESAFQRAVKARESGVWSWISSTSHWCKWSEAENERNKWSSYLALYFLGQPTTEPTHAIKYADFFLLTSSIFCPKKGKLKLWAGALEFLRDIKAKWQFSWYENHLISQQLNIPVGRTIRQWVTKDISLQSLQIPFLCDISGIKIIIKGPEWYFSKALFLKFHICCFPGNDFHSFEITKLILFCFCFALFCFFPLYFYIF